MIPEEKSYPAGISACRVLALLGLLLLLVYSNTFSVPWHLDDYNNILINSEIHVEPPNLPDVAAPLVPVLEKGYSKRAIAYTSFALNWYLGRDNPFGYHAVNLLIHIFTAYFVFLTILALFKAPRLDGIYSRQQKFFISLLAATLWAVNPIQVQAVTYIVQRMASLCGMFYVMSIYFYVNARSCTFPTKKAIQLFTASSLCFWAAILTKENAGMLPISLLLIEAVFFQDMDRRNVRLTILGITIALGLVTVIVGAFVFKGGNLLGFFNYESRLFTPLERLLTQPRILLFYLSLIFYPAPNRLSLVHDIDISTSFLNPWTTLPSILIVFALIGFAIYKLKKWPIPSFAVLFFFLNHVVESSIIALELIFEHRNYLPSLFIFWPVAVGLERLIVIYRQKSRTVYYVLLTFIPLLIIGMGISTYVRNIDWSSEKYLWEDAMHKAPRSSRPKQMLAFTHYERIGDRDTALALYQKAIEGEKYSIVTEPRTWNNIAAIYHFRGDFEQAARFWRKSVTSAKPKVERQFRLRLALALIRIDKLDDAMTELNVILARTPEYVKGLNLRAIVLLMQQRPQEALSILQQCLRLEPNNGRLLINVGACFHYMGNYQKAGLYFSEALRRTARSRIALLWQIKNRLESGNTANIDKDLEELLTRASIGKLTAWLHKRVAMEIYKDDVLVPRIDDKLIDLIKAQYLRKLDQMGG